jgi:2-phosphosulfolactate phosphatase
MTIDVCLTPELLPQHGNLAETSVIVVDVLRATSVMVTALAHDVAHIVPVAELAECAALGQQGYLTAAERDGQQAAGFDLGNSPFSYQNETVRGRALAMTTTNGTLAIRRALAQGAEALCAGAFLNLAAVGAWAQGLNQPVLVVCAGWKGAVNLEDTLFAGALIEALAPSGGKTASDSAIAARHLWLAAKANPVDFLQESSHVQRLARLSENLRRDVAFCLTADVYTVVPEWHEDALRILSR